MTFIVTKSFHSVNEKLINSESTITNVMADHDNKIIISSIDNKYPLVKYDTNMCDVDHLIKRKSIKLDNCEVIKELSSTNVKFIGNICQDIICVVPKHQFQLITLKKQAVKHISINNNHNVRHDLVEIITNSNHELCKCHECYHLVGFVNICEFNIVIQLMCTHKSSMRSIIIMKSTLDISSMCLFNTSVLSVIDFFTTCRNNDLHKKVPEKSVITSVTSNKCDKIYVLSSYGKKGHVWVIPFFSGLNFLGTPGLITQLNSYPRGITCMNKNINNNTVLFVVCNTDNKLTYYTVVCPVFSSSQN